MVSFTFVFLTAVQSDRRTRQLVPAEHLYKTTRAGRADINREARNIARPRLFRQFIRFLS